MGNLDLIGAVGIKVKPDASGFRSETKRDVMAALQGVEGEVPVTPVVSSGRLRSEVAAAARAADTTVDVKLRLDRGFVDRELERVASKLKSFDDRKLKLGVQLDGANEAVREHAELVHDLEARYKRLDSQKLANLTRAQGEVSRLDKELLKNTQAQERAAARLVVAREKAAAGNAKAVQTVKDLEKSVASLSKTEERLQSEREAAAKRVARAEQARLDMQRGLRAELEREQRALEGAKNMQELITKNYERRMELARQMNVIDTGSAEQLTNLLGEQRREHESLSDVLDRILSQAGQLENIDYQNLREWAKNDFARSRVAHLRVEADTAMAEAQLTALERTRSVRILAHVDSSLSRFAEMLRPNGELDEGLDNLKSKYREVGLAGASAMSGIAQYRRMTDEMLEGIQNLDTIASNAARSFTLVGSVAFAAVGALGAGSMLARDLVTIGKGLAILPAGIATLGLAATTLYSGITVFGKAMTEGSDALREINTVAADTADTLGKMFTDATLEGQRRFFSNSELQLGRMGQSLAPIADLWTRAYDTQGKYFSGLLEGVNAWYDSGDMSRTVDNLALALDNASGSAKPLLQGLLDITDVGASRMPQVTQYLTESAESFASWAREAKNSGAIDRILVSAWTETKNLASVARSAVGIIGAFASAAEDAGYGGLAAMAEGANRVESALESDLYQGGMTNIFRGVKDGSADAVQGLGRVADAVMITSEYWEHYARTTGNTVGTVGGHIARMLRDSEALPGMKKFLDDVNEAAGNAGGLVRDAGDAFGQAATTSGELVKAGEQISSAMFRAWADTGQLTQGVNELIPVFGGFTAAGVGVIHEFLSPFMDGAGALMSWFAGLPSGVQTGTLALAAFVAIAGKLSALGGGSALRGLGTAFPVLGAAVDAARGKVETFRGAWMNVAQAINNGGTFQGITRDVRNLENDLSRADRSRLQFVGGWQQMTGAITGMGGAWSRANGDVGRFQGGLQGLSNFMAGGLRLSMGSLVSFLGGPWGIAFMAAGAAFTYFASKSAEAKQAVSDLRGTLDEVGGATDATVKQLSTAFDEAWSDRTVNNMKRVGEAAEATGKSQTDLARDIAESAGKDWSQYRTNLEDVYQALNALNDTSPEFINDAADLDAYRESTANAGDALSGLSDRQRELVEQMGDGKAITAEMSMELFGTTEAAGLNKQEIAGLIQEYDKQRASLETAQRKQREYAESMGLNVKGAQELSSAMKTMNDETASTADKAQAFAQAMDVATGGTRSFLQSVTAQEQSMTSLAQAFATVAEKGAGGAGAMVEYTNSLGETSYRLNTTVGELAQLDGALQSSYDSTVAHAQAVYDNALAQGKSVTEASRLASDAMGTWRDSAREQLQAMGVDAQQAEAYLNDIAGQEWQATLTFMGRTEDFMKAQQAVKDKGGELDGAAFTAFLQANPGMSYEQIQGLIDRGLEWDSARFSATFDFDRAGLDAAIAEIAADGAEWDNAEYTAALKGDSEPFLEAIIDARSQGVALNDEEFRPFLGLDKATYDDLIGSVRADKEEFGSVPWVARLDLENPGFAEKYYAADQSMHALTDEEWEARLRSNLDEVKREQENLLGGMQSLNGTVAEVTVKSNAAAEFIIADMFRKKMEGMSDMQIRAEYQAKLGIDDQEWNDLISGLPGEWESAKAPIEQNKARPGADTAQFDTDVAFTKTSWADTKAWLDNEKARLQAQDDTATGISEATNSVTMNWVGKGFSAVLDATNDAVKTKTAEANEVGNLFASGRFASTLDSDNEPMKGKTAEATQVGNNFAGTTFTSTSDNNPVPAQGKFNMLHGEGGEWARSLFTSTSDTNPAPANQNFRALDNMGFSWMRSLFTSTTDTNTNPARGGFNSAHSMGNTWDWASFSASLVAANNTAGGIGAATNSVNSSWTGKVFTAYLQAVGRGIGSAVGAAARALRSADGNFFPQAFANGGFTREVHQAMIAPGNPTYRVWAEPETGGEAYIPLAPAKRSRSTKILGQVAEKFGYTVQKYADGGMEYVGGVKHGEVYAQNTNVQVAPVSIDTSGMERVMADGLQNLGGVRPVFILNGQKLYGEMEKIRRKMERV